MITFTFMKNLYALPATLLILITSCSSSDHSNKLIGKWAGMPNDSTYMETWFNDSLILEWNTEFWHFEALPYRLHDSILQTSADHFKEVEYELNIEFINDDSLVLSDEYRSWHFSRISHISPFIAWRNDSIEDELFKRSEAKLNSIKR